MSHKKSGFVALIGRPNVGKSTLMNTICGHKIAIVSHVPQTTRNMIKGIYTEGDTQMVFLDTPGIHESAKLYNKVLSSQAKEATAEADVILYMVDVSRPFGREEEVIMEMLRTIDKPVIIAMNKVDIKGERVAEQSLKLNALFADFPKVSVHYISGLRGSFLEPLLADIKAHLPEGEFYYPAGMYTDQTIEFMVAEVVRESVLHHTFEEVPHATRTEVGHIDDTGEHLLSLFVDIFVERETQKGILIGKKAEKLKEIGIDARQKLEKLFHKKVFLKLSVKVDAGWRASR